MARVNISIPDQLLLHARAEDLNISQLTSAALSTELERRSKHAALGRYLRDLEAEFGPVSAEEAAEAKTWADEVFPPRPAGDGTGAAETTLILDAGGVSALAGHRGRLAQWFLRDDELPALVPVVVLTEVLTWDSRRDHEADQLLRFCEIHPVDESLAREGARLRTLTRESSPISVTDAMVVAFAATQVGPIVLTTNAEQLTALGQHALQPVTVTPV